MKLSELKTGQKATIKKVSGHGSFRKRIIEMGFIKGQTVEVMLNAPLQDPVKYKVMGYEVSLRRSEAGMIDVSLSAQSRSDNGMPAANGALTGEALTSESHESISSDTSQDEEKTISVALVGNPNCGKTSFFNFASGAHERVGNYSGVTVDAKEGYTTYKGYRFNLVDLPGTYSLSAYSPEELYVREHLVEHTPDVILNVIDTSNLERNLYLTTQLIDMDMRIVCALNMFDESEHRGDTLHYRQLGSLLGVPMVPTVFTTGRGVDELLSTIITVFEQDISSSATEAAHHDGQFRHIHINHGHELEDGISNIQHYLKTNDLLKQRYSTRFLAIKLLENDSKVEQLVDSLPEAKDILAARDMAASRIKEEMDIDSETAIMDAKYGFIHGALGEVGYEVGKKADTYSTTHVLDNIITHRYLVARRHHRHAAARRPAARYALRRRDRRCGSSDSVSAADTYSLHVHILHGGQRLHGASCFHHGQAHAQDGSPRQIVHSAYHGLRLQRAGDNGYAHHREPTVAAYHHARTAANELFGPTTYLYNDSRHVLRTAISLVGAYLALRRRHPHGRNRKPSAQPLCGERRRHTLRHGASALPFPHLQGHTSPHVGEG